jgi:ketosteroid isomerase-like protein
MSQENVEIALRFVSLYNAQDLVAAVQLCTDDVAVAPDRSVFPEGDPFRGRDAFLDFLQQTWAAWAGGAVVTREVFEAPCERVVMRTDWEAKGSGSGLNVSTNLSAVYTFSRGKVAAAAYFFDHARGPQIRGAGGVGASPTGGLLSADGCRAGACPPSETGARPCAPSARPCCGAHAAAPRLRGRP